MPTLKEVRATIFALILATCVGRAAPQSPSFNWADALGGAGDDICEAMAVDSAGALYLSVYSTSSVVRIGEFSITTENFPGTILAKIDRNREVSWFSTFPQCQITAVSVGANGETYAAGTFWGTTLSVAGTNLTLAGFLDDFLFNNGFVASFDSNGSLRWLAHVQAATVDATAIVASGTNVFVAFTFAGRGSKCGDITVTNTDTAIYRFSTDGTPIAALPFGVSPVWNEVAWISGMAINSVNDIFVVGVFARETFKIGTKILTNSVNPGNFEGFIAKLTTNLDCVWAKALNGSHYDVFLGIAPLPDGGMAVHGQVTGPSKIDGTELQAGMFVGRLNRDGDILWMNSPWFSAMSSIAVDSHTNVYVGGRPYEVGYSTISVAKFGSHGNMEWVAASQIGHTYYDPLIAINESDALYISGTANESPSRFGEHGLDSYGGLDAFVAQLATEAPALSIRVQHGSATASWSTNYVGYGLQFSTTLNDWTWMPHEISGSGFNCGSQPTTEGSVFFRLQSLNGE